MMCKTVQSFETAIFLDKRQKSRRIHKVSIRNVPKGYLNRYKDNSRYSFILT